MHGKTSSSRTRRPRRLPRRPQPFVAGRYHSLVVADPLPESLEAGGPHRGRHDHGRPPPHFPVHGVQFHPESVLTGEGRQLLRNFLEL